MKKIIMSFICIFSILMNYSVVYGQEAFNHLVSSSEDTIISRGYILNNAIILS